MQFLNDLHEDKEPNEPHRIEKDPSKEAHMDLVLFRLLDG
jgi:hypothetical protein